MPITLQPKVYEAFGVQCSSLSRSPGTKLSKRDLASLLAASFLINMNLYSKMTFDSMSSPSLVAELERSIESNHAFDGNAGNFKPEAINDLARTLSTIPLLKNLFGSNLIYKSFIEDAHHGVKLSDKAGKSPLETLEALCEFDSRIHYGEAVSLNSENIHYLVAIPRRRSYSYAYNAATGEFLIAEERTAPSIIVGNMRLMGNWYGGRLHIKDNVIGVDDRAGGVKIDVQRIVEYLRVQYQGKGYFFINFKEMNPILQAELVVNFSDVLKYYLHCLSQKYLQRLDVLIEDEMLIDNRIDRDFLLIIIRELIDNALDFPQGGNVEVRLTKKDNQAVFSVRNKQGINWEMLREKALQACHERRLYCSPKGVILAPENEKTGSESRILVSVEDVEQMDDVFLLFIFGLSVRPKESDFGRVGKGISYVRKKVTEGGGSLKIKSDQFSTTFSVIFDLL